MLQGELQLYAPHKRPSTLTVAGVISLCLRVIDEKQRAEAELNSASADVDRFKFSPDSIYITSPRSLGAAKDDAGEQRNPYQPLASLVENTRVFMRICDTVAAVSQILTSSDSLIDLQTCLVSSVFIRRLESRLGII